jgi:mono/diheme cytochrome c family protein
MSGAKIVSGLLIVCVVVGIGFFALSWHSSFDPGPVPDTRSFPPDVVAQGAVLASAGNCMTCHTAPGGKPFAGGFPVATPFGTIYGTNITPDPNTGIGEWSEAAFHRALRQGVRRDGAHLYPAFPYDHFTLLNDQDIRALYAYLMTREPVRATPPANDLPFPLTVRPLLAGWKLMFFDEGPSQPGQAVDPNFSRGAYLVAGIAHCGGCHTPRNMLGAEKRDAQFAGGEGEGWHAPALNGASASPMPWTGGQLYDYLKTGSADLHGTAAGPMADVVRGLAALPDEDIRAIAAYMAGFARRPAGEQPAQRTEPQIAQAAAPAAPPEGIAAVFAGSCATCHSATLAENFFQALPLSLSTEIASPDPRNLIHIIREGIHPKEGEAGRWMPGFAGALTDPQIAELANYLRTRFGKRDAWPDLDKRMREIASIEDQP